MLKGRLIALEGGEGVGKSTLANTLLQQIPNSLLLREPGGTQLGEQLRKLILADTYQDIPEGSKALLFAAARLNLVREVILPNLAMGKTVILDRYLVSSYVYQGLCTPLGLTYIQQINAPAFKLANPAVTFYLDIDPAVALARLAANKRGTNYIDRQPLSYHLKVREGYRNLTARQSALGMRIVTLDAAAGTAAMAQVVHSNLATRHV